VAVHTGIVKWFNAEKGFGFIEQVAVARTCSRTSATSLPRGFRELQKGPRVSFDITDGQKGPQAENIVPS
jgi:CspA family cold shock protein